ncbi:DNA-binding transcriptional LysR family regulator [Paenibacillus phyllosphaerae]|uniref:DNA-binding transcriptional LysR family regulator n=1 Tax=Paenibacillus phyllosphaerae TaxID=274593 RepID=A0A7W5FPG1_9BACL|nr:LysR family transcriptional regulator [Paenibacillus phyllosphaerae]MBB3112228.1 DNA-binding transcriptional LysR family regulator [Paenibacillus phyllosphaerae]
MDIKQLRYFIAIAEEGQITAAAKRLHMAQPPLSQQLRAMEEELGARLFERDGRGMQLTEEGRALYKHAVRIVSSVQEAADEVQAIRHGLRGRLAIGINTLSDERLPRILRLFQQRYPNFTFSIQQNDSAHLCQQLKERSIDLAIVRLPLELDGFTLHYVKSEPHYFVTAYDCDEPGGSISFTRMARHPLIVPSTEGLGLYQLIREEFMKRGLEPNIVCECSDITTLMQLVSSGFGATIVPETVVKLHRGVPVRKYALEGNPSPALFGLIGHASGWVSKAAQAFIEAYREAGSKAAE